VAVTRLKAAVNEVVAVAKQAPNASVLAKNVRPILLKIISFQTMTRRAVGPGWREFTPDQQKEATRLFTTLIIRTYTAKFTPGEFPDIIFKEALSPAPGRVEVPTTILYHGSHYEVIYRQDEADAWRITDVIIEGVSMIANYRTQFDAQFKEGGATAVIKALNQSVNSPK
jgi:phospholipid transport system substrate-binding protein